MNLFLSLLLGLVISYSSLKAKLLSFSGAVATYILAFITFYYGGIKWTMPMVIFFVFSSVLSKLRKKYNPKVDTYFQKSDVRDHYQVFANGGFPGMLILINQIFSSELFYIAYVSAIASSCADTWATEIGTFLNVKTYNITDFKLIEQGISGGVSLIGIFGALLGSITISLSALMWLTNVQLIFIIIVSGFSACIFDSILGAKLQVKYFCRICSKIVERKNHCNSTANYLSGFKWLNNDLVNLSASIFGGLISLAFTQLVL